MDPDILECGHNNMKRAVLWYIAKLEVNELRRKVSRETKLAQSSMIQNPEQSND